MDQFANRQLYRWPSEPKEWFYDSRAVRSDSFGFLEAAVVAGSGGATLSSIPVTANRLQWKQDRILLGITASVEANISPVAADTDILAAAYLGYGDATSINLIGPASQEDGGIPNLFCGTFCSLNLPAGTAGTKSKNFGIGFGRTPFFIPAGGPVKWFVIYSSTIPVVTGQLAGSATFYTIQAR